MKDRKFFILTKEYYMIVLVLVISLLFFAINTDDLF